MGEMNEKVEIHFQGCNLKRDYDKDPIIIIDYGVLFELNYLLLVWLIALPFVILDVNLLIISNNLFTFETIRMLFLLLVMIWITYDVFVSYPRKFREKQSYFELTNKTISYHYFADNTNYKDITSVVDVVNIKSVKYCVVSELQERFGRFHKLSAWQLYRQSSIGVHIGKATLFIRYLLSYLLFVFPYKIWSLHRLGEPFSMLSKNLVIKFNNRDYFLINVYKKEELEVLKQYFEREGILISKKTSFIPHLQNQGWFAPEEEKWTNDFNQGDK